MRIIGLVGGVGSGKTTVAAELERCGARVLDADRAGHHVLRQDDVRRAVRERWGDAVMDRDGHVDRRAVARIVFGPPPNGPRELEFLERLTHPRIRAVLEQKLAELSGQGVAAAVLDAAVMLKAGWDELCDWVVFVDAPREVRWARCRRRGWTARQFDQREAAQQSLPDKRARADVIVDNRGSLAETRDQVERFWHRIVADADQKTNQPDH